MGSRGSRSRIERQLRRERPDAPDALVEALARRIEAVPRRGTSFRVAFAGALSATMLVALASVGGIGYAANAALQAAEVMKKTVAPAKGEGAIAVFGISSGGDQYRPGYGFGDPNHNHTGPPGLRRQGTGEATPPLVRGRRTGDGKAVTVRTVIVLDEQASLRIQVLDQTGRAILLTQRSRRGGTQIGGNALDGPQSKTLRYTVLVPRAIPLVLRIPANLLRGDQAYRIRVAATDPDGNKQVFIIPFRLAT